MLGQQFFGVEKYAHFIEENFVPVRAVEDEEAGEELEETYEIGGGPSVAIVKSDGSLYDILTSYENAENYLQRMKNSLKGIDTYASIKEKYDQNPDDLRMMFALADKHTRMWQTEKGVELCEEILKRSEEAKSLDVPFQGGMINLYEVARYGVGYSTWFTKRSPKGLEEFRAEFPQSILTREVYSDLADMYLNLPVSEESDSFYYDLKIKYPEDPSLLNKIVRYYIKTGRDLDRGEEYARKLLKLEPESVGYRQNAADLFLKNNREKEALEVYGEEYIGDFMDEPRWLNGYAWFWALRGKNLKSALAASKKSIALDLEDDNLLDTLSMVYWKMKEYEKAIKTEEKAFQMNPNPGYRERIENIKKDMTKKVK